MNEPKNPVLEPLDHEDMADAADEVVAILASKTYTPENRILMALASLSSAEMRALHMGAVMSSSVSNEDAAGRLGVSPSTIGRRVAMMGGEAYLNRGARIFAQRLLRGVGGE